MNQEETAEEPSSNEAEAQPRADAVRQLEGDLPTGDKVDGMTIGGSAAAVGRVAVYGKLVEVAMAALAFTCPKCREQRLVGDADTARMFRQGAVIHAKCVTCGVNYAVKQSRVLQAMGRKR